MPFDALFEPDFLPPGRLPLPQPAARGLGNYHAGLAAETTIAARYQAQGHGIAARRWRGSRSELDLVVSAADGMTIFVEVKYARTHDLAACRVSAGQRSRLILTAEEYCARLFGRPDVYMRFDLALVDAMGRVDVIENAFFE